MRYECTAWADERRNTGLPTELGEVSLYSTNSLHQSCVQRRAASEREQQHQHMGDRYHAESSRRRSDGGNAYKTLTPLCGANGAVITTSSVCCKISCICICSRTTRKHTNRNQKCCDTVRGLYDYRVDLRPGRNPDLVFAKRHRGFEACNANPHRQHRTQQEPKTHGK